MQGVVSDRRELNCLKTPTGMQPLRVCHAAGRTGSRSCRTDGTKPIPSVVVMDRSPFSIELKEAASADGKRGSFRLYIGQLVTFLRASTLEGSGSALKQGQRWAMLAARVSRILPIPTHPETAVTPLESATVMPNLQLKIAKGPISSSKLEGWASERVYLQSVPRRGQEEPCVVGWCIKMGV